MFREELWGWSMVQTASVLGRLYTACPFSLEKRRVAGNGIDRGLLNYGRHVNRNWLFAISSSIKTKGCQMALVRARCKTNQKEIIQVILYAAGSRSVELLSGECCGFKKFRSVQVEAMLFFPLPYLSLCLYKHFNADQECIFEVNPRSCPLNMPHLTSQNGLILHKLDSFQNKLNQTCWEEVLKIFGAGILHACPDIYYSSLAVTYSPVGDSFLS